MFRKILLSLVLLVVLAFGALFTLLATNSDIIIDKFHSYVENSTGAPLISQTRPVFTLLPNRGLELGASSWQKPDGSLSISFSRASVLISSHDLFVGRFSIKNFTVEDLKLTMRLEKPLRDYARNVAKKLGERRDIDAVVRFVLESLSIAPDVVNVQRGLICLIEPSGNRIEFAPFTLTATDVHPGSRTEFSLSTDISGTAPAFKAEAELNFSALFTKRDASFTVKDATLTPKEGFSFTEPLTFSGAMGYDYSSSAFNFSSLEFNGPALSMKTSGGIDSLSDFYSNPKHGSAHAALELKCLPQELGSLAGIAQPFSTFELKTDLRWELGALKFLSMQGSADDLRFSGDLQSSFLPPTLSGRLDFEELDLDAFKGRTSAENFSNMEQNDFTRWPRVSLQIGAKKLLWDRLVIEDVSLRMTGQNGTYEFNPFTGRFAGSPLTASIRTVMLPTSPLSARIGLNFSAPEADLDELSRLLLKQELLSGKGAVNAALSFTSSRGLPSLSGNGSLSSSSLKTSFSILPPHMPIVSLLNSGNSFERLLVSFQAKEGIFDIRKFTLEAPRFALNGKGRLDLPKKNIDASGSMRIGGSTVLPVRLYGKVNDPKYSLDMSSNAASPASLDLTLDGDLARQLDKIIGAPR